MNLTVEKTTKTDHVVSLMSDKSELEIIIDGKKVAALSRAGIFKIFETRSNDLGIAIGYVKEGDKFKVLGMKEIENAK